MEALGRFLSKPTAAWATVVVVLLLAGISISAARHLQHEDDILAFLPQTNPEVQSFYEINKRFGGLDVALVGIEADDPLAPDFLERLRRVTFELKEVQGLNHVMSLANLVDFTPDKERGGIITGPLIQTIPRSAKERAELRANVMSKDHVVGNLISSDGKAVLIYCFLAFGSDPKSVTHSIRGIVEAGFPGYPTYWGGNPFISTYIFTTTQDDIRRLTPWAALAIVLIMMVAFRDVVATVLALLSTGIGIAISLGLMASLGIRFNIVLGSMPIIMLALGSAYAIHILAHYYTLSLEGDTASAVRRTVTSIGPTVLAAGLTTVASLLSFVFMDIQPLRIFGLFTAIGLFVKLILAITFIPAVLCLGNFKRKPASSETLRRAMSGLSYFAQRHRRSVALVFFLVAVGSVAWTGKVDLRMDQASFFSSGSPPDLAEKYLRRHFGGSQFLQLHIKGDMTDPLLLRELQRMADEIALMPHVSSVLHLGQAVAQVNEAMTGQRRIPDSREQVQTLFTFLASDPSVSQLVTDDRRQALVQIKIDASSAAEAEATLTALETWSRAEGELRFSAEAIQGAASSTIRRRQQVLARILAAAHLYGIPLETRTLDHLRRHLDDPVGSLPAQAVEQTLLRFLRSEECSAELPRAPDDPRGKIAAALARLGPRVDEQTLKRRLAEILDRPLEDGSVDDLALSLAAPLQEIWSSQISCARATRLLGSAALPFSDETRRERFTAAVSWALLDLDTPTALMPSSAGPLALRLQVSGLPVMNRGLERSIMANQIKSLSFALIFVLVIFSLLFRSLLSGLLAMTPALFTLLGIYGGMGLFGIHLDIGTSMLASIILGAGVDYAVHLLAAWRTPPRGNLGDAAARAGDRAGLAIWTNAVMVGMGFFILTLGQARPLKTVGGLTAAAMLSAALCTFLAIPALARRRCYRKLSAAEAEEEDACAGEVALADKVRH